MPTVEFGGLPEANAARDRWDDHLCPDDDRRLKTVRFASDTPDTVLDRATVEAAATRDERDGPGQLDLTDGERDRIDFSKDGANVPHAQAVKGIMRSEGVDDWIAYYDPTLTVDEHRDVATNATQDEAGQRLDAEDTTDERLARTEKAVGEECDHARDHCEHGDPAACEFLTESCGMSEDQVESILDDQQGDPGKGELPGEAYGALQQLWNAFRAEISQAKEAAAGINEIRAQYGQDPLEFDELGGRPITKNDLSDS